MLARVWAILECHFRVWRRSALRGGVPAGGRRSGPSSSTNPTKASGCEAPTPSRGSSRNKSASRSSLVTLHPAHHRAGRPRRHRRRKSRHGSSPTRRCRGDPPRARARHPRRCGPHGRNHPHHQLTARSTKPTDSKSTAGAPPPPPCRAAGKTASSPYATPSRSAASAPGPGLACAPGHRDDGRAGRPIRASWSRVQARSRNVTAAAHLVVLTGAVGHAHELLRERTKLRDFCG